MVGEINENCTTNTFSIDNFHCIEHSFTLSKYFQ